MPAQANTELNITQPDDWHLHLRDGFALQAVAPHTARQFRRAIIMPNLRPPITTVAQALAYRTRILGVLPDGTDFEPLMTLYLTDNTSTEEIRIAAESEHVYAVKLYPAGATTNSDEGITTMTGVYPAFEAMENQGLPLLVHAEVTDAAVDVFDREAVFIDRHLQSIVAQFPQLRVVFEHITTRNAVQFVDSAGTAVVATITPHHLHLNRNHIFTGGIRPHHFCLPVLKREEDRQNFRLLIRASMQGANITMRISCPTFVIIPAGLSSPKSLSRVGGTGKYF